MLAIRSLRRGFGVDGEGASTSFARRLLAALSHRMTSRLDIRVPLRYSDLERRLYMTPTISNRVKELRATRGWTQEQLAKAAKVSRQSINSIERNRYVPSLELALIFARIFECPTDTIFQLEKEQ